MHCGQNYVRPLFNQQPPALECIEPQAYFAQINEKQETRNKKQEMDDEFAMVSLAILGNKMLQPNEYGRKQLCIQ
jgi:hypothetical protein